jgi:hypothetical protein
MKEQTGSSRPSSDGGCIGLPLAAIASICVVLFFKYATGPVEFKALGFEFSGASGPVVLWVMCLLAITPGIRVLW